MYTPQEVGYSGILGPIALQNDKLGNHIPLHIQPFSMYSNWIQSVADAAAITEYG